MPSYNIAASKKNKKQYMDDHNLSRYKVWQELESTPTLIYASIPRRKPPTAFSTLLSCSENSSANRTFGQEKGEAARNHQQANCSCSFTLLLTIIITAIRIRETRGGKTNTDRYIKFYSLQMESYFLSVIFFLHMTLNIRRVFETLQT